MPLNFGDDKISIAIISWMCFSKPFSNPVPNLPVIKVETNLFMTEMSDGSLEVQLQRINYFAELLHKDGLYLA